MALKIGNWQAVTVVSFGTAHQSRSEVDYVMLIWLEKLKVKDTR